jgi:hypothetical protein
MAESERMFEPFQVEIDIQPDPQLVHRDGNGIACHIGIPTSCCTDAAKTHCRRLQEKEAPQRLFGREWFVLMV